MATPPPPYRRRLDAPESPFSAVLILAGGVLPALAYTCLLQSAGTPFQPLADVFVNCMGDPYTFPAFFVTVVGIIRICLHPHLNPLRWGYLGAMSRLCGTPMAVVVAMVTLLVWMICWACFGHFMLDIPWFKGAFMVLVVPPVLFVAGTVVVGLSVWRNEQRQEERRRLLGRGGPQQGARYGGV